MLCLITLLGCLGEKTGDPIPRQPLNPFFPHICILLVDATCEGTEVPFCRMRCTHPAATAPSVPVQPRGHRRREGAVGGEEGAMS